MTPAAAGPLEMMRKGYEAAYNTGDASALAELYTDDAVVMPYDGSTRIGAEGVKSYYQPRFDQFTTNIAISVEESGMLGDWAFARGNYMATLTPKTGGKTLEIQGKWVEICAVQGDGSWKIARHIWNSPTPLMLPGR